MPPTNPSGRRDSSIPGLLVVVASSTIAVVAVEAAFVGAETWTMMAFALAAVLIGAACVVGYLLHVLGEGDATEPRATAAPVPEPEPEAQPAATRPRVVPRPLVH